MKTIITLENNSMKFYEPIINETFVIEKLNERFIVCSIDEDGDKTILSQFDEPEKAIKYLRGIIINKKIMNEVNKVIRK